MLMDAKVYTPIVKLIMISREDLKMNGIKISRNMHETLILIRSYFEKQISLGQAPPISEVAQHFKIRLRQLRRQHKAVYKHSLQSYITRKRMETAESLLLETEETITNIAYTLGYELNTFQKQFRIHFNRSATEYRKRYKQ
jgi:AraC-like DNA-binding protein